MPTAKPTAITNVHRIKVTLKHIKPPIWRRLEIAGYTKLPKLHEAIQIAMGWTDTHLHQFIVGRETYGVPDPEWGNDVKNEKTVKLEQIAAEGDRLICEYDFGDGWEHELQIEAVTPPEKGMRYPRCTGGKRACPPEDCGGPPGYESLLQALADPAHEEHTHIKEWLGREFDPEGFDLAEVNEALRRIK